MRGFLAALAALTVLGWVAVSGCGQKGWEDGARSATELPDPEELLLSEPLMIALSQARNYHHKADVYLKQGKLDEAIAAVREVLSIPFPAGAAEGEDVLLDARARLGKLLLRRGDLDEALAVVDAGIAASSRGSFYLANLHRVRGEIFEAKASALPEAAREEQRGARVEAIRAFDRSIAINEELLQKLAREPLR